MKLIHINIGDTYILDDKRIGSPLVTVERIETGLKPPLVWVSEPARGERYPTTVEWLKPVPVSPHD